MKVTKLLFEREEYKDIYIYIYPTIRSVYKAFCDGDMKNKYIKTYEHGKLIKVPIKEAIKNSAKYGCWGFEEDKESIHLWFSPDVPTNKLISLLSHEIAHITRPHHKSSKKEEAKAQKFQDVADFATSLANKLLNKDYMYTDAVGCEDCKATISHGK